MEKYDLHVTKITKYSAIYFHVSPHVRGAFSISIPKNSCAVRCVYCVHNTQIFTPFVQIFLRQNIVLHYVKSKLFGESFFFI